MSPVLFGILLVVAVFLRVVLKDGRGSVTTTLGQDLEREDRGAS